MTGILERALAPDNLDRAWRAMHGDQAPWSPGIERSEMERHRLRHQLELVEDLRRGRYRCCAMRQFSMRKADGGQRVLSALYLRDKFLQRAVAQALDLEAERLFHDDSFGYRRGRGVDQAMDRCRQRIRCGLPWLVDADIRRFFDRIPQRSLLHQVKRQLRDAALLSLLRQWLDAGTYAEGILGTRRGIPQGAVVSPFLCNLYLDQLDRAWQDHGIPFVRYADDFVLFAPDQQTAQRSLNFTRQTLQRLGLELHPDKTRVVLSGPDVIFLGRPLPAMPRSFSRTQPQQTFQSPTASQTQGRTWLKTMRLFL